MSNSSLPRVTRSKFTIAVAALAVFGVPLFGQAPPHRSDATGLAGIPEDWASHHVVFTDPGTEEDSIRAGRHDQWLRIVNDPRYIMQQFQRNAEVRGPAAADPLQFLQTHFSHSQPGAQPADHKLPKLKSSIKNDWSVNLTTSSVMANTFPAKYSFAPIGAPSCTTDFVAYPTGATGSATAATIVAFNELYPGAAPGCGTTGVPQFYWAYNTTIAGTAPGAVTTSPVLSLDGTKVAFIQSDGASANLIVLKTAPAGGESVTAPVSITSASANMGCTAPCMTVTRLSNAGGLGDTFSSPFYDYANDVLYVGDNNSTLYKIGPIFNSTTTSPVSTALALDSFGVTYSHTITSPVYDSVSGCVFAGDMGGFFYSVNSGIPGTVCTSSTFSLNAHTSELSTKSDGGMHDAVLVDSQAGEVYAFVGDGGNVTQCGSGINCVVQYPVNFVTGAAPGGAEPIGNAGFAQYIFAGAFDNVYLSSADLAHPTGNLWVVGNVNNFEAANLYRVPITANVLGTPSATVVNVAAQTSGNPPYSPGFATPITEFCNNGGSPCGVSSGKTTSGTDSIYFGINQGVASGCHSASAGTGCVVAYNISNPATPTLTGNINYTFPGENASGVLGCWGTSAIVIDNASTSTGASEVYYMYLGGNSPPEGTSGCSAASGNTVRAIQALQGTL